MLLMIDVRETEYSPIVVQHPFTSSGVVGIRNNGEVQLLDITSNPDNLRLWREQVWKQIESSDSAYSIFLQVNKPYGLTFLRYAAPHLSQADMSRILASAWILSENPNADANMKKRDLISLFHSASPDVLMTEEERVELGSLESPVTVYRGVTPYNGKNVRALSWTLNYDTAKWFANRFGEHGTVYEAQVGKDHILALFNGRNEAEVIVDPKYLSNIVQMAMPEMEFGL